MADTVAKLGLTGLIETIVVFELMYHNGDYLDDYD